MANATPQAEAAVAANRSNSPLVGIVRERIVFDNSLVGPVETVTEESKEVECDVGCDGMPSLADATIVPAAAPPPKATRNKIKFAKRKVLATSSVFLKPDHMGIFADTIVEVVGRIQECPRRSNSNRFRVDWRKNNNNPLPAGLREEYLREFYDNSPQNRELLKAAMDRYDTVFGASSEKTTTANVDGTRVRVSLPRGPSTPPEIARGRAASAARTMASHSSISTITDHSSDWQERENPNSNNVSNTSTRRETRANSGPDPFDSGMASDIEDGDDLDDDEDDYQMRMAGVLLVTDDELDDDGDDSSDKDNDKSVPQEIEPGGSAGGVAQVLKNLQWGFERLEPDNIVKDTNQPEYYDGPSGLKPGVSQNFNDPLDCLGFAGGLDYKFIARLARNSNEYARKELVVNGRLHRHPWQLITTEEMYHFLGITLKISLSPIDGGGYEAYFRSANRVIHGLEIANSAGFAQEIMTLWRYKQIRSAFHPEPRYVGLQSGDKAYQLRHAINTLNEAARRTFFVGKDLTFDEGGVSSRSRMNPIRQYNGQKPDKFRIDFFLMCDSYNYIVHHIDVYQGKNAPNIGIHQEIKDCKTTMKVVLNAVLACNLDHSTEGARHITLDNRYQSPELCYILRERYGILSTGTCRANRVGWNKMLCPWRRPSHGEVIFVLMTASTEYSPFSGMTRRLSTLSLLLSIVQLTRHQDKKGMRGSRTPVLRSSESIKSRCLASTRMTRCVLPVAALPKKHTTRNGIKRGTSPCWILCF